MKTYFETLAKTIFGNLKSNEHLYLNLNGDDTQFVRVNGAKVRQSGVVENHYLSFIFIVGNDEKSLKSAQGQVTLTLDPKEDLARMNHWLNRFRAELPNFRPTRSKPLPTKRKEFYFHANRLQTNSLQKFSPLI
jgi:hypothetical protein